MDDQIVTLAKNIGYLEAVNEMIKWFIGNSNVTKSSTLEQLQKMNRAKDNT